MSQRSRSSRGTATSPPEGDRYVGRWRLPAPAPGAPALRPCTLAGLLRAVDPAAARQAGAEIPRAWGVEAGPLYEFFANAAPFCDGRPHQARRAALESALAHPVTARLRPRVQAEAEGLLGPLAGLGEVDYDEALCGPLPARVIAGVLGLPEADIPRFVALALSAAGAPGFPEGDALNDAVRDLGELETYLSELLEERRERPREDFLSEFIDRAEDYELNEAELRWQLIGLCLIGAEAGRAAIAFATARVLANPEAWRALRDDPKRAKASAAAEALRFDPPVGVLPRIARTEVEIEGRTAPADAPLRPCLRGALRDPAIYADPDEFDITRTDHPDPHPAFGAGAHRCPAEGPARVLLEEALAALARFAPDAALVDAPPSDAEPQAGLRVRL